METRNTTELAQKIEKIARLAFDRGATNGEAATAATMIVQIARKNGIDYDGFINLLGFTARGSRMCMTNVPVVMPFGKYRGRTLDEIYLIDSDYLQWFVETVTKYKQLRGQIIAFLKTKQN